MVTAIVVNVPGSTRSDTSASEFLEKVKSLIEGFETPYGMELLSTVHWVVNDDPEAAHNVQKAILDVYSWNTRKKQLFSPDHIKIAWKRLYNQDWILQETHS